MSIIVTDHGFGQEDFSGEILTWEDGTLIDGEGKGDYAIDLPNTAAPSALIPHFDAASMIRIAFPSFADGRAFTLARHLRQLGYQGRLRAYGHVISDQYAMIRRCGFDEVEISSELATRQPESEWQFRANWQEKNYQHRMQAQG